MPKKPSQARLKGARPKPESNAPQNFFLTAPLAFLSLALLWCQVGYLTPEFSRPLGAILWLLTVYLSAESRKLIWLGLSAVLLFNPYGAAIRGEGLYLLPLLPWAGGFWGNRWMGASLLAALGGWLWLNFPGWWVPFDEFAADVSRWLTGANLSSAAAGLPLLAMALCFPIWALLTERRPFPHLAAIGGLILTTLIYWRLQRGLESSLHSMRFYSLHDAFNMQWALLILLLTVILIWSIWNKPVLVEKVAKRNRPVWVLAPALIFLGAILIGWPPKTVRPHYGKQVIFYNKGYLNWDLPKYGFYGQHAGGMFGLIPEYLRWRGFNVALKDSLRPQNLDSAGVVVFINLMDSLSTAEEEALHRFVNGGGSILLLGDHTGLANIRDPSNRLLKPYGIELNFDSAKPLRTGWAGSMMGAEHPLTTNLGIDRLGRTGTDAATQIWIGASLKVSPPGKPVITGRDGFSDIGNEKNEKDGFLGDFRYKVNERLGNLVLLAESRSGKGKVLVFGDTSTIQNGALVRAGDWVVRIFDWLLAESGPASAFVRWLGILLLAGGIALIFALRAESLLLTAGALTLFVGVVISQYRIATALPANATAWTEAAYPRALLDHSHAPRTVLNQVSADGHWGLQNCLLRSQFLPQVMLRWDERKLNEAKILIEIAPSKSFSRKEQKQMNDFMQRGGLVIFCCGTEEFDGSVSLLKSYGLEPLYVPLGPAQVKDTVFLPPDNDTLGTVAERELTVEFHKVWEVKVTNPNARALLTGYDKPLVNFIPVGRGGLLFIPDTDFLMNRNLESPSAEPKEENILFLRYLLMNLAEGK